MSACQHVTKFSYKFNFRNIVILANEDHSRKKNTKVCRKKSINFKSIIHLLGETQEIRRKLVYDGLCGQAENLHCTYHICTPLIAPSQEHDATALLRTLTFNSYRKPQYCIGCVYIYFSVQKFVI